MSRHIVVVADDAFCRFDAAHLRARSVWRNYYDASLVDRRKTFFLPLGPGHLWWGAGGAAGAPRGIKPTAARSLVFSIVASLDANPEAGGGRVAAFKAVRSHAMAKYKHFVHAVPRYDASLTKGYLDAAKHVAFRGRFQTICIPIAY